jgi:O-antigen/teichoic acid export membrane protein
MTSSAFSSGRVTWALLASVLSQFVNAAQTYLLVPLYVSAWGSEKYGHWLALTALATYIGLVDLGGQMSVGNRLATAFAQGRERDFVETLQRGLSVIGALAFGAWLISAGAVLAPFNAWDNESKLVLLVYSTAIAIGVPSGVLVSCYAATGRVVRGQNLSNLSRVVTLVVSMLALALHVSLPGYAGVQLACAIGLASVVTLDLLRQAPSLFKPRFSARALRDATPLLRESLPYWVFGLTNALAIQGVLLAISANADGQTVATFTTHRAMASVITYAGGLLRPAIWTELTFLAAHADYPRIRAFVRLIVRTSTWLATVVGCAICLVAPVAYTVWTRSRLQLDVPLMIILAAQAALWSAWAPLSWPLMSANQPRTLARWSLINSAITVAGAYACMRAGWGLRGLAAWSLAVDVVCGLIPFPIAAFAFMQGSVWSFVRDVARAALCSAPFGLLAYACLSISSDLARFATFGLGSLVLSWPCLRLLYGARDFARVQSSLLGALRWPRRA